MPGGLARGGSDLGVTRGSGLTLQRLLAFVPTREAGISEA